MANPQVENGHTDIANEVMEAFCKFRIPGEVRQVIDVIIRKTWGWHKKQDDISLDQFAELTGMKKPNIVRALSEATKHNLVIKHINKKYSFNKNYEEWKCFEYKQGGRKIINHDNTSKLSEAKVLSATITENVITHDNKSLSSTIPTKETTKESKEIYKRKFGEFNNVLLSVEEYQKLIDRFSEQDAKNRIETLSGYMESKGKRYKSHYATIINWARGEGVSSQGKEKEL